MLNLAGYRLLSHLREKRDWKAVRLSLYLMAEYDIANFKILSARVLAAQLGRHRVNIRQALTRLVRVGFLEEGPRVLRSPTYRIRPAFLLTSYQQEQMARRLREREEREALAPWTGLAPQRARPGTGRPSAKP
jgi:DNA-binding transcriptional regulator PaaX